MVKPFPKTRFCRGIRAFVQQTPVPAYLLLAMAVVMGFIVFGRLVVSIDTEAGNGRRTVCEYANRIADGARQDRQFLVVLSQRPGSSSSPDRDAVVKAYLEYGDLAYPHLDCDKVVAGESPPPLPTVPPPPLAAVTTTVQPPSTTTPSD